jgi:hypothetical protein
MLVVGKDGILIVSMKILFWDPVLLCREDGCEWRRKRRFAFWENAFKAGLTSTNRGIS